MNKWKSGPEAKTTNNKPGKTQKMQMLSTIKCMAILQGQSISKQKYLLVQVAGSHRKYKTVRNANLFDTSPKWHLKRCSKLAHIVVES